jgi:Flp pilus assembly CpaE family ATPase
MQGLLYPGSKRLRRETVTLNGRVNLGATGAVSTQTKQKLSGFVVARTGVGTYTITLSARYSELLGLDVNIIGANATYAATAGREMFITSDLTTTTKVITIKFLRTDTGAVAEVEDNAKLLFEINLAQTPTVEG